MPEINEGFAQLSEQLMLVAGLAYAVAFCAYAWDLVTFSQAVKKGLAGGQDPGVQDSKDAALVGARGAAGQGLEAGPQDRVCAPAARPMRAPTASPPATPCATARNAAWWPAWPWH